MAASAHDRPGTRRGRQLAGLVLAGALLAATGACSDDGGDGGDLTLDAWIAAVDQACGTPGVDPAGLATTLDELGSPAEASTDSSTPPEATPAEAERFAQLVGELADLGDRAGSDGADPALVTEALAVRTDAQDAADRLGLTTCSGLLGTAAGSADAVLADQLVPALMDQGLTEDEARCVADGLVAAVGAEALAAGGTAAGDLSAEQEQAVLDTFAACLTEERRAELQTPGAPPGDGTTAPTTITV